MKTKTSNRQSRSKANLKVAPSAPSAPSAPFASPEKFVESMQEAEKVALASNPVQLTPQEMSQRLWFNSMTGVLVGSNATIVLVPMRLPDADTGSVPKAFDATGFSQDGPDANLFLFFPLNSQVVHPNVLICAALSSYLADSDQISPQAAAVISMNLLTTCGAIPPMRFFRPERVFLADPKNPLTPQIVLNKDNADLEANFFAAEMSVEDFTLEMLTRFQKELGRSMTPEDFITFAKNNSLLVNSL